MKMVEHNANVLNKLSSQPTGKNHHEFYKQLKIASKRYRSFATANNKEL